MSRIIDYDGPLERWEAAVKEADAFLAPIKELLDFNNPRDRKFREVFIMAALTVEERPPPKHPYDPLKEFRAQYPEVFQKELWVLEQERLEALEQAKHRAEMRSEEQSEEQSDGWVDDFLKDA